jgi:hypothetical protein
LLGEGYTKGDERILFDYFPRSNYSWVIDVWSDLNLTHTSMMKSKCRGSASLRDCLVWLQSKTIRGC